MQQLRGEGRDPQDVRPNPQEALLPAGREAGGLDGAGSSLDDEPSVFEEGFSCRGELGSPAVARQERDPEPSLERLDLLREPWLSDSEAFSGPAEMPFLGHGEEVLELTELQATHVSSSNGRRIPCNSGLGGSK